MSSWRSGLGVGLKSSRGFDSRPGRNQGGNGSSGVFKGEGGIGRCPPPFELEVCRQSLGPLYVNDFADVTPPPPMLADVLCSKSGTLHSSLGVYD